MTNEQWIETVAPAAQAAMRKTGYFASLLIAQSCQETGFGRDSGLLPYHNIVGMKTALTSDWKWNGESVRYLTFEFVHRKRVNKYDYFRKYSSYEECLIDFAGFVTKTSKYRGVADLKTPREQITAIQQRGYATDPSYVTSVMALVDKYNLTKYDKLYLSTGSRGEEVKVMQQDLTDIGISVGGVDSIWGEGTENGVLAFQKNYQLPQTGEYDPKTRQTLEEVHKIRMCVPVFSFSYYRAKYPDLQKAYPNDNGGLLRHFYLFGMKEGRQASCAFNVQIYRAKYPDLQKAFGNDLKKYYLHFIDYGLKEGRVGI